MWTSQRVVDHLDLRRIKRSGRSVTKARCHLFGTEAGLGGLGPPALLERLDVDVVVLGLAGIQRRDLRGARGAVRGLGEHLVDLVATFRERRDHLARHADHLGVAVHDRREPHAQPRREKMAQVCLIQVSGCVSMLVQPSTGDRLPARSAIGVLDVRHVRGHDMGVQQRITGPARRDDRTRRRRSLPTGPDDGRQRAAGANTALVS